MKGSPAFQFYPADYLADMRVRMLTWSSRGLYIDLLCYCWREGWIPSDSSAIAQLSGCHDLAIVEPCLTLFSPCPSNPGRLVHKRLDEEKKKQEAYKKERAEAGKNGALKRWANYSSANGSAKVLPLAKNSSSSSPSPSPSSSDTSLKRCRAKFIPPTLEQVIEFGDTLSPKLSTPEAFIDHHEARGWKLNRSPMVDWKACVRTWHRNEQRFASEKKPAHRQTGYQENLDLP